MRTNDNKIKFQHESKYRLLKWKRINIDNKTKSAHRQIKGIIKRRSVLHETRDLEREQKGCLKDDGWEILRSDEKTQIITLLPKLVIHKKINAHLDV